MRKLLTGIVFCGWLGAIVLIIGVFTSVNGLRLSPAGLAISVVVGIALTLLVGVAHANSRAQRLWQATRHEPIRRRRWLRWLGVGRAQICPFCRDDLGAEVCECPECAASYHPECVQELSACATLGCEGLGVRRSKPAKAKVTLLDPALPG